MPLVSRAWSLEPQQFHREVDTLRNAPDGLLALRDAAMDVWRSDDATLRPYLEMLELGDPEEWMRGPEPVHVVDWYRLLMGPHLVPVGGCAQPDVLRRRLPELGWPPMDARRLARGRDLLSLAREHSTSALADDLSLHMRSGTKGWLHNDDLVADLDRLRGLDPRVFRGRKELVPVVEEAFEVLAAASRHPERVVIVTCGTPYEAAGTAWFAGSRPAAARAEAS
jgi:hypothetical protein